MHTYMRAFKQVYNIYLSEDTLHGTCMNMCVYRCICKIQLSDTYIQLITYIHIHANMHPAIHTVQASINPATHPSVR